jgi:protein MAK11
LNNNLNMTSIRSSGIVIAAGTYDGVLAGWELQQNTEKTGLELAFATSVHTGSIRSLSIAASPNGDEPGPLLSCGYDEALRTHDWHKRMTSSGEVRTPSDFGTPVCSAFAPPTKQSTHCVVGFTSGKVCIYKKRDWSVQHVLAGHEGGVGSIAVHPTGKLALTAGVSDGKLKLWDLTKGRLAFVNKIKPSSQLGGAARYDPVASLVWSPDGDFFAMAYGSHITVRDVSTGKDLLDVDLPSRVNQVTLMSGPEGLFVAAACNDGSLPVLAVEDSADEARRAIMAIEPVDSHLAREERFKCICSVRGYYVVTANSAGVVSLMNLEGAVRMIMSDDNAEENTDDENDQFDDDEDEDSSEQDEDDVDLAVDILESTRLGTGARITCLAAWCMDEETQEEKRVETKTSPEMPAKTEERQYQRIEASEIEARSYKRKVTDDNETMDDATMKKARSLVEQAKTLKKKKDKKKKKKAKASSN